jgi:hypothetical protein
MMWKRLPLAALSTFKNPDSQIKYKITTTFFKERESGRETVKFIRANEVFVHRIVTSELTFYLKTLKTLHALPLDELADNAMDDIWISR